MANEQDSYWADYARRTGRDYAVYKKTQRLSTHLMLAASLDTSYYWDFTDAQRVRRRKPFLSKDNATEIGRAVQRIHAVVKVFEGAVWYYGGLQDRVNRSKSAGMSGVSLGVKVLLFCTAGRCLITLSRVNVTDQSLTLITADDEEPFNRQEHCFAPTADIGMGPMGIQGIDCSEWMALDMLGRLLKKPLEVQDDRKVGVG